MADDWRHYAEFEEEFEKKAPTVKHTKKKKTWKQINEERKREVTKKQWQKKRRISKKKEDK
jgi:hypothetical protein